MSLHLKCRPGDAQALKVCIAAALANKQIVIDASTEPACSNLFGSPSILLATADGVLTEPNAAAFCILGRLNDILDGANLQA